jgi:hypothetical protein
MSQATANAEELFRFAVTRAPVPAATRTSCIELADASAVPAWLEQAPQADFGQQFAQLQQAWLTLASCAAEPMFARLHGAASGILHVDLVKLFPAVPARAAVADVDALYTALWKFYLQGIASSLVAEDALRHVQRMIVMTALLQAMAHGDAGSMTAEQLRDAIGRKIRLPIAFSEHMRRAREARVEHMGAARRQQHEEHGQRVGALLASLAQLERLERQCVDALGHAPDAAPAKPAMAFSSKGDAADMVQRLQCAADMAPALRAATDSLQQDLKAAGVATAGLTPWQVLDEIRRTMSRQVAAVARLAGKGHGAQALTHAAPEVRQLLAPLVNASVAVGEPVSIERFGIRPLGVADLRVVRQVLVRYEKGELAHIENVMMGEEFERTHELVQRKDESIYESYEGEAESTRDTQSTERFEMGREARSAAQKWFGGQLGLNASDTYGTMSVNASVNIYTQRSSDESLMESLNRSREVTAFALDRVREAVYEQRYLSASVELREKARHKHASGTCHRVAHYRWIDKVYQAQVYNYGARAMYELMVPRPAAMFLHLTEKTQEHALAAQAPVKPDIRAFQITEATWLACAERFGVTLPPPPPMALTEYAQASYPSVMSGKPVITGMFNALDAVDKGYFAASGGCSMLWYGARDQCGITASIGTRLFSSSPDPDYQIPAQALGSETGAVTFNASGWGAIHQYTVNFYLVWLRTERALEQWQLACLDIIMSDYKAQLAAFKEKAATDPKPATMSESQMRTIEKTELRRAVLEIVRSANGSGAPAPSISQAGTPQIDVGMLGRAASEVRFFEQAFEWDQMTYRFHPYFWNGTPKQWDASAFAAHGDALFSAFLSAGFATVVLPVRTGYEDAAALYFQTGIVSGLPIEPADKALADMNREVSQRNELVDDGVPEGEAWQYRVPTSLVMLEDGGEHALPDFSATLVHPVLPFIAGGQTCDNQQYNKADWPDPAGIEVVTELRKLGYPVSFSYPSAQLGSPMGMALVRAFQHFCNQSGLAHSIGPKLLAEDGLMGPCTLRALSEARRLRRAGSWSGPALSAA